MKKTRQKYVRLRKAIKEGYSKSFLRRKFKKIPIKAFNEVYVSSSTMDVLIKRFYRARNNTVLGDSYFKKYSFKRAKNHFIVTFTAKVTNKKTGMSDISTFSYGYDRPKKRRQIFEGIEDMLLQFVKESPDLEVEFLEIIYLSSRRGTF